MRKATRNPASGRPNGRPRGQPGERAHQQPSPPAPVSRRAERARRPWPATQSRLPDATLIVGASAILFVPILTPFTLLLCPVAWAMGAQHARTARKQGREPSSVAELGKAMGKIVSLLFLIPASAAFVVGVIYAVLAWAGYG